VTKKVFLGIVLGIKKFRTYLIGSDVVVFYDHTALKHLFKKNAAMPRLI